MGVIYIGDRDTGKTHLVLELANPRGNYVKVTYPDYQYLRGFFLDLELGSPRPTGSIAPEAIFEQYIEVNVILPTGEKMIALDWLDTPGEIWRKSWQKNQPDEWQRFLETIRKAEGIMLILPPYRDIIKPTSQVNLADFITRQQWCNRFDRWLEFFQQDCPKIRHLLLCLNKADLVPIDLEEEARKLAFNPDFQPMTWQERDNYVFQRYFRPIHPQINQLNRSIQGLTIRCFITSIYNRKLLELPWIYLGSHLAK
ncbi:MAG: hypothetical protein IM550_04905 [Microcystis sp. M54BS1]|nr:hypothetical protein [Microcystis sp. M62BS1]MCA2512008.1 hypothetical protein [Microcystis sp. M60BS1]MCA2513778.1 hypothetical protein [Microcystis sp. M59BS1]MCA2519006.1 hypothetical protein [Microcystis sp. M63BS1]MCA2527395.1 hypothetical protein [Microcystis sp. M61BS1]MCA2529518.1 hypothetical protein [Microcystis sp. M51BS1]MCA2533108.1 hypothetical protein [Microcystis sp. M57BS1]MCA2538595.1 hypothetical protein [Microcystis sp. M54BS1]MCA2543966.1 hypothetical protein [Microc